LELHEPDLAVRERLAKSFSAWIEAIAECLSQAKARLPTDQHLRELAQFVLTVMEGGVMQARTFRDIEYFDAAVRQLRQYFKCLERPRKLAPRKQRAESQIKKTREKNNA
jgi:TetR/AcrR family transcriptional regulator, transcriptional repressor for nem operon